jgi:hypothetical protein
MVCNRWATEYLLKASGMAMALTITAEGSISTLWNHASISMMQTWTSGWFVICSHWTERNSKAVLNIGIAFEALQANFVARSLSKQSAASLRICHHYYFIDQGSDGTNTPTSCTNGISSTSTELQRNLEMLSLFRKKLHGGGRIATHMQSAWWWRRLYFFVILTYQVTESVAR